MIYINEIYYRIHSNFTQFLLKTPFPQPSNGDFSFKNSSTCAGIANGTTQCGNQKNNSQLSQMLQGYARIIPQKWTGSLVKDFLSRHIDSAELGKWGQGAAKSFEQLAKELIRGECQFMWDETSIQPLILKY